MSSSYRQELDNWLENLEVKADSVLDIGGSQLSVKKRTATWDVGEYKIADLPNPHVDSPKPDIELDLNYIDTLHFFKPPKKYDLIFCLEVMEYVFNPVAAMANIATRLVEEGEAWVTFPAFYPTHQPIEDDSLRYMEGGIRKLALSAGLEIMEMIKRRPESEFLNAFWSAERMRAAKNYDHYFTGWIVRFKKC